MSKCKPLHLFIKIGITVTIVTSTLFLALFLVRQITDPVLKTCLEDFIRGAGSLGWFIVMFLQFFQIVIAPIPAEPVQIIAGVLYGTWGGLLLMILGSIPASILVWNIGRKYGKPMLCQLFGEKKINKITFINQTSEFEMIAVVMFSLPLVPKDIFSYLCGITSMKYSRYLIISTLARIPATLLYTMMGDSLHDGRWGFVIFIVLLVLIIISGNKYKDRQSDKKSRILLSEGSSLTARETLTALHGCSCHVDVLSSSALSITAFSCWKKRTIQIENLNKEPEKYLWQVSRLLESGEYITILPTHEAAWMFAEARRYLPENAPIAVSAAAAFRRVQGKIAFAFVADEIGLPIPPWQMCGEALRLTCPCWLKADYGTAGRSVFKINKPDDIAREIEAFSVSTNQLMLQEHISGQYGQVQAIFNHGMMIAVHTTMQQGIGAGGSAAARISVDYPVTREHINRLGRFLDWHGSITLDFIYKDEIPYYIECNPRMVEPANAALAGVNFPQILTGLSEGQNITHLMIGRPGIKTHSTMALLLGTAEQTYSRRMIIKVLLQCLTKTGPRADSTEVLTPILRDPLSIVPLLVILFSLLINPHKVQSIAGQTVENYCVLPDTISRFF